LMDDRMAQGDLVSVSDGTVSASPLEKTTATSTLARVMQGLGMIALALLSYFLISHFLVQSVKVVGMSMVPRGDDPPMTSRSSTAFGALQAIATAAAVGAATAPARCDQSTISRPPSKCSTSAVMLSTQSPSFA